MELTDKGFKSGYHSHAERHKGKYDCMFVMNGKTENISEELKIVMKNQMEILELKHSISEIKIYLLSL